MPILPPVAPSQRGTRQIPQTPTPQPLIAPAFDSMARGVDALGRGAAAVANTLLDERASDLRLKDALDRRAEIDARREADDLHGAFRSRFTGLMHGAVGPDGSATEGWDALKPDSLDSEEGGAAKRLAAAQREFVGSDGYAALSPRARTLFDARAQADFDALASRAVAIDAANALARRKALDQANIAAALSAADAAPLDDDEAWSGAAARAAADAAVIRMGAEVLNPEALYEGGPAPDPSRLRFANGEAMRAVFAADAAKTKESLTAARAARMLDAARAEKDLDTQEGFLREAEAFAERHAAPEKIRADVRSAAEAVRASALRTETLAALDTLATGGAYDTQGNPRREAALKAAMPKIEAARRAETSRALSANAEFVGAMVGAGAWFDADGNVRALPLEERRDLLLSQLAAGNIRIGDYTRQKAALDRIERSGLKDRHERLSAEVAAALGTEIKTVWTDAGAVLAKDIDPSGKIGEYSVPETRRELVPEMETATGYRGGTLFGVPAAQARNTGRLVERETVTRRKRELLAADVTKVIDLLMSADAADGLHLDLDGNPATPDKPFDARAYKAGLLADIKARQMAVDIDAQAQTLAAALSARRRDNAAAEAAAITKNAAMRLPRAETRPGGTEEDDAD